MFKWLHEKLHPKSEREKLIERIEREQNYSVSEALSDLIEYLIDHHDQCEIISNNGCWIVIGIDDHIVCIWVASWPFATMNQVLIFPRSFYEQNKDKIYRLYDVGPDTLWSIDDRVPRAELVLRFHELFYPEIIRHAWSSLSLRDDHERLMSILSAITLSLNEKSKKTELNVDKNEKSMDSGEE